MNNFVMINHSSATNTSIPLRVCIFVFVILIQIGWAHAGGASAVVTVTAKITTCRPVIEAKNYQVTVKPSDGRGEWGAEYGRSYFPAEVVTIDNTSCENDVDVSGRSFTSKIHNPSVELQGIGAIGTLNDQAGRVGGWRYDNYIATLTVKAGTKTTLYAGISPQSNQTDYISGTAEGAITLTLTPR